MEISQLLLDVLSKTNNFQKRLLYFRPKLTAKQGSSAGTVLDPLLDYIGNAQNWTAAACKELQMPLWSRKVLWSLRIVKTFLQNIPQQLCKHSYRAVERLCDSDTARYACIFISLCILCSWFFVWFFLRDPCFQREIQESLCEEYRRGLIAGILCYDMCIEQTFSLSSCVSDERGITVFSKNGLLYKVTQDKQTEEPVVKDGITVEEFWDLLQGFFTRTLGIGDHTALILKALDFVDFNQDEIISYGEVNSFWQLLQIHEFRTLFVFQGNSVFPVINSTCGRLYSFQNPSHTILYDLSLKSVLDSVFSHRYRWFFPDWPKRVHIALGLLEYSSLAMEENSAKFYMCDFKSTNFGYTEYFEMKVTNIENIYTESVLGTLLRNKKCLQDSDCVIGKYCKSVCDNHTNHCTGTVLIPDFVHICEIISEYLLYDSPPAVKFDLGRLISRCKKLSKAPGETNSSIEIQQNLLMNEMHQILWDLLKNEPNKWLYKSSRKI